MNWGTDRMQLWMQAGRWRGAAPLVWCTWTKPTSATRQNMLPSQTAKFGAQGLLGQGKIRILLLHQEPFVL